MANLLATIAKAMVKGKLNIGELNGLERYILAQLTLPDRIPTQIGATNIEPYLVDPKYNYKMLAESEEANLELFDQVCNLLHADAVFVPIWQGLMFTGAAELGTKFKIDEDRVPYSVGYPIQRKEDIKKIKLPDEPTGHLKMYFNINKEAQRRHPDMIIPLLFDGPWDLAMLLRGDDKLPMDMRLHKDFVETDDPVRKEKIKKRGDPDIFPAIMELTTQLAIRHVDLAVQYGLPLTVSVLLDQYAASPIMSRQDYVKYVLPYIERVWLYHKKRLTIGYMCPSPGEIEEIMETEPPGINQQFAFSSYIFPTTPEGISLPEFDKHAFELAKKHKKNFTYVIHGKFLRDATEQEIDALIKRVCTLAVEMRTSITVNISSVPPGSNLDRVNLVVELVKKYGRY